MSSRPPFAERLRRALAAFNGRDSFAAGEPRLGLPSEAPALPPATSAEEPAGTEARVSPPIDVDALVTRCWQAWVPRIERLLSDPIALEPSDYDNVLLAAAGLPPGTLLRANIHTMQISEWNALAVAGLPYPGWTRTRPSSAPAPRWALLLALHRLGFDPTVLRAALGDYANPASSNLVERLIQSASFGRKGLLIVPDAPGYVDLVSQAASVPVLAISANDLPRYIETLSPMSLAGGFAAVITESPIPVPILPTPPIFHVPRDPTHSHMIGALAAITMKN